MGEIKSMEKIRVMKQLGAIHPELADLLLTLESEMVANVDRIAEAKAVVDAAADLIDSCPRCQGHDSTGWPATPENILECAEHRELREALAARGEG